MKDKENLNEGKPNIGENFDKLKMFEGLEVDEEAGRAAIAEARRLHKRRKIERVAIIFVCVLLIVVWSWIVSEIVHNNRVGEDTDNRINVYMNGEVEELELDEPQGVEAPSQTYSSTDESDIIKYKSLFEDMLTPDYIPKGYEF